MNKTQRFFTYNFMLLFFGITLGAIRIPLANACDIPPFTQTTTPANVLILYDTSASMRELINAKAFGVKQINGENYYPGDYNYNTAYAVHTTTSGKTFSANSVYDVYENLIEADVNNFNPFPSNATKTNWMKDNLEIQGWTSSSHPNRNSNWYGFQNTYFLGNYLNFLHANAMRDDVGRAAIYDLVNSTSGVSFGLMAYKFRGSGSDDNNLGGLMVAPVNSDKTAFLNAINSYSGDKSDSNNNTGLIMNAFGQTPIAKQLRDAVTYFQSGYTNPDGTTFSSPLDVKCEQTFAIIVTDGYPTGGDMTEAEVGAICSNYSDTDDNKGVDDLAGCYYDTDLSALDGTQNLVTYTIGFGSVSASATDLLEDTALNGRGAYFNAENASELATAFESIVSNIMARASSGTAASVVSTTGEGANRILRASFHPSGWEGYLEAYDFTGYSSSSTPLWEAGQLLEDTSADNRTIYTVVDSDSDGRIDDLADFSTSSFYYNNFNTKLDVSDSDIDNLINYVRGEDMAGWRIRDEDTDTNVWKLGDIVNSSPTVAGAPPFFYHQNNYQQFHSTYKDRAKVAYVGSGNGMLEAFNLDDGTERWAMIPNMLLEKLQGLSNSAYCRLAFVDNSPKLLDAYINYEDGTGASQIGWRTLLLQGLRKGGTGYFAVDVTDPAQPPNPLWEYPGLGTLSSYPYDVSGNYECDGAACSLSSSPIAVSGGLASLKENSPTTVWWNGAFAYRRQITITNTSAASSINAYPVYVDFTDHYGLVQSGKAQEDGSDVRVIFCSNDSTCNEIHRVPKKIWNSNSASVEVWFKIQESIAANSTDSRYYLYYGNPTLGQTPLSTCSNIFQACEEFNTDGGTPAGWSTTGGTWSVINGQLHSDTDSGITGVMYRNDWQTGDKVITVDYYSPVPTGEYQNGFIIFDFQAANSWKYAGAREGADQWRIGHFNGSWRSKASFSEVVNQDQWYAMTAEKVGETGSFYRDHAWMLSLNFLTSGVGSIGTGGIGLSTERGLAIYDNFTVHPYTADAPTAILGTEEGLYASDNPTITTQAGVVLPFTKLTSFSVGYGEHHAGMVKFQLSHDGADWYWYNSVAATWEDVAGGGYLKSNTPVEINDQIGDFPTVIGTGSLYLKAFFHSDGSQKVELDRVSVGIDTGSSNLGQSWSVPATGRMKIDSNDEWTMAVGSGPHNSDTKGYTLVLNLEDGSLVWSKKVSNDVNNQMTSAEVIDTNSDGYLDHIYNNDLMGKMYRFDTSDTDTTNWTQLTLFDAGTTQPFTAGPIAAYGEGTDIWVFSGTGRFLSPSDPSNTDQQAFYAIKDEGVARVLADLTERTLQTDTAPTSGATVLIPTGSACTSSPNGWYINLPQAGERVVSKASVVSGVLFFTTFVPNVEPCGFGGDAYLYALDYSTGCSTDKPVLNITGDGEVNEDDKVGGKAALGMKIASGVPSAPQVVITSSSGTGSNAKVVTQTSSTEIAITNVLLPETGAKLGSWKEAK